MKISKETKNNNISKYSTKKVILCFLFIIWFIGSFLGIFIVFSFNPLYSIILIGQYFLVFGFVFCFQKSFIGVFLAIVGFFMIAFPILLLTPGIEELQIDWSFIISLILSVACILIGIGFIFIPKIKYNNFKFGKKEKIIANVVQVKTIKESSYVLYAPVYEYSYDGKKYTYSKRYYSNTINDRKGDQVTLKVLKNNPSIVIEKGNFSDVILDILGFVFIGAGITIFILIVIMDYFS